MLDRRHDKIFFGPEVVNLRTSSDARELSDSRRRRPGVAVGDQALNRGVKQPRAHGGTAFRLCPPNTSFADFRHHRDPTRLSVNSRSYILIRTQCYMNQSMPPRVAAPR